MKSIYMIKLTPTRSAQVDCSRSMYCDEVDDSDAYCINRVFVPSDFRGQGFGSKVLALCLEDADRLNVTLWLTINPYGDLDYKSLDAWYKRNGFVFNGEVYVRKPKTKGRSNAN